MKFHVDMISTQIFVSKWCRHQNSWFLSFFVDVKYMLCRFLSNVCSTHVDDMGSTKINIKSTCNRQKTTKIMNFDVDMMSTKKSTKSRQKSTKIDKKSTKINQNRPKLVDTMSTNDIRTTSERHKGLGKHVSFWGRFLSTSCRQNDYFLSTFCRFWSIFVDFGRLFVDQNRQKVDKK